MNEHSTVQQKPPLFRGDQVDRIIAIMIALVTILASVAAFLEIDARSAAEEAKRDAQQNAIRAMGLKAEGQIRSGFAWTDAFRLWAELDTLALEECDRGNDAAAIRYEEARDRLTELIPELSDRYFDPTFVYALDRWELEADLYVRDATTYSEQFKKSADLEDAWEQKANSYVTHLTLLAVVLFLFGISTTIAARTRWLLVGMGVLLVGIVLLWMTVVTVRPVPRLSDDAINSYADGYALAYEGGYEAAIDSLSQALDEAPRYASALYERGNAYYQLERLDEAAADYEAALRAAGSEGDVSSAWNLGWTYYRLGEMEDAIRVTQRGLDIDDSQVGLNFNLGLMQLTNGDIDTAWETYSDSMLLAIDQTYNAWEAGKEPPWSLWLYMDLAADDLDDVLDCLNENDCENAPPREAIASPDEVAASAVALREQLKNLTVALEYDILLSETEPVAEISPFQFGVALYDEEGNFSDYDISEVFSSDTEQVLLLFDYEGMQDGDLVLVKVYDDEFEDPSLRYADEWTLGPSGGGELAFTASNYVGFSRGEYAVEMYVDAQLVQEGKFTVE
jgi:tetratricopeptide (TPR) repeat protein